MNNQQSAWDRMLLTRFITHFNTGNGSLRMHYLSVVFQDITGVDPMTLKRTPRNHHHGTMTVSRFVCGHLPRLAMILIDKNKSLDDVPDLVDKLQRWNIDTLMSERQQKQESAEKSYSKLKYLGDRLEVSGMLSFKEKSSGHAGHMGKANHPRAIRGHFN